MTRQIAHIIIEADTPIKVGSNASDFLQDAPVQKDWNGLPMILGTSIAGVLRKDFNDDADDIFGKEKGSKIIFSNALLVDENGEVCEELLLEKSDFFKIFENLPIREHTAIDDKGVVKEHSKFDEEIVYKGTRFKFSIEMIEDDKKSLASILKLLASSSFRLGGGSTKGFGKCKIIEIKTQEFDLKSYQNYNSSLNYKLTDTKDIKIIPSLKYTKYVLEIQPDDFFIFGSGFGDENADITQMYEQIIDYTNATLSKKMILIPASSIKGAIAHRTTYHYNLENKFFIGNAEAKTELPELFGEAKNSKKNIKGSKGKLLISDCYKTDRKETKIFDHVSIDRFTAGAINEALFQEKTIAQKEIWEIEILLKKDVDEGYVKSFEKALDDITTGMLPLGGMTTKGHGLFNGKVLKNGKELCHE